MKTVDYIITILFIIAIIALFFIGTCALDIYFLIAGIVVAIVGFAGLLLQGRS